MTKTRGMGGIFGEDYPNLNKSEKDNFDVGFKKEPSEASKRRLINNIKEYTSLYYYDNKTGKIKMNASNKYANKEQK